MPSTKSTLQRNKEKVLEYKKTLCCSRCGIDDYRVLDFHHEGEKDKSVSNLLCRGYAWQRIQKEIDKCIPLCANCHRLEHWKD